MSKIGIYGGSFNPIHNGHVSIAREMVGQGLVDELWFVVSPHNPLKDSGTLLSDDIRLKMVQAALQDDPRLKASDFEFHLPRPSYMWNTLQAMASRWPGHEFVLVIGADNWQCFSRWYHYDDILARHRILIYPRQGSDVDVAALPPTVRLVRTALHDISSTQIRRMIVQGNNIEDMVPPQVAGIIKEEGLYR